MRNLVKSKTQLLYRIDSLMSILESFIKSLLLFFKCFGFIGSIIITLNLDKFDVT